MNASTTTARFATPILDREASLPPRAVPGAGLTALLTIWLAAAAVIVVCWLLDRPPILRQWALASLRPWFFEQRASIGILGLVVAVVAAFYLMLAIHELGHVVAGWSSGFRCRSLRVGPILIDRSFHISLYSGPGAIVQGVAELCPGASEWLVWRGAAMVAGGPLANLITAIAVVLLPFRITAFSGAFVVCSLVNAASDLLPFESRLGISDGRRLWILLRQPKRGERWLALLRLGAELNDGVLPEAMAADFLAQATAVCDDSVDTVTANSLAFMAAFHQHNDADAAHRLETALAHAGHALPVLREALASDAAVFQARRRNRPDLAEQWLSEIPVTTSNASFRARAEAAILESRGDVVGASRKLDEVETAILSLPENRRREALLRLLQRWQSDLSPGVLG